MPLVIEGNKHGIKSKFFTFYIEKDFERCKKLDSHPYKHLNFLKKMSVDFDFDFELCDNDKEIEGMTFFGERRGLSNMSKKSNTKKIVLVNLRDFVADGWYDYYVKIVDNVIFPNKFFAEYYKKVSDKNLYLGSPKYDVEFNKSEIKTKYNIKGNKNALVMFPTGGQKLYKKVKIDIVYDVLRKLGYNIIVKSKKRWPCPECLKGDIHLDDSQWFPHPTLELIKISDIVINYCSSTVKECVMLNTPFINFWTKEKRTPFRFLYNYDYCENIKDFGISSGELEDKVKRLTNENLISEFEKSRKNYLFEREGVSTRIFAELGIASIGH